MILRPYQIDAVARVLPLLREGRRVVLVAPTGSGKTIMGASAVASLGRHARWTAHRRELIAQAREKVPAACDVFSVQERTTKPAGLIVVDEAHHATAASYRRHLDVHAGPVLGLTATPFRLDGKGLGEVFDAIVVATTAAELVESGTLIAPRYFSVGQVDEAKLHKIGGDFRQDEIAAAMDKPSVIGDAVREYRTRTPGARAVVFCVTVEHARNVAAEFCAAGINAEIVSGETPKAARDAVLERLRSGATRVVANCMILTEGWDLPALEVAIILRPTASLCLHLQMIGRIMRAAEGKAGATVLDHAGNVKRLGFATDHIEYSLEGRIVAPSSATNLKTCPECYAIVPRHVPICACGHVFTAADADEKDHRDGIGGAEDLVELKAKIVIDEEAIRRRAMELYPHDERKRAFFKMLEKASGLGHKLTSAEYKYNGVYGEFPPSDWLPKYRHWMEIRKANVNR